MTLCHMIRLHGDTNGNSLNERPAALASSRPSHPPLPCFLSFISSSLSPTLFPLSQFICSVLFIDLFQIVLDRRAAMISPTHILNWMASHYSRQATHSVTNISDINQCYRDQSSLAVPN